MSLEKNDCCDKNRIARDYAFARIELISKCDLNGYCLQDIQNLESDFHNAQMNLLASLKGIERSAELRVSVQFEGLVVAIKIKMQHESDNKSKLLLNVSSSSSVVALPKISIRPFDGKIENWTSFKQLFDSLIHNKDIPLVEKFHYLLSSVQGGAYNLIKNYPLCDNNYEIAYKVLTSNYENKRIIAINLYERLLKCESVKSKGALELKRVSQTFRENLDILSKYSLPDKNFMLFYLLWSKLDSSTKEAFEFQQNSDVDIPTYESLCSFIDKRSRAFENSSNHVETVFKKPSSKNSTTLVVHRACCILCNGTNHPIESCPDFLKLSPSERYHKIKSYKLCLLCFSLEHSVRDCSSVRFCNKCQLKHHTLLHFENSSESGMATTLTVPGTNTPCLFSTAIVLIKNRYHKFIPIRILLDSASACNFISMRCIKKLGLRSNSYNQSINGIGQVSTNTLGRVTCEIIPSNGDFSCRFNLDAFVLTQICTDMPPAPINTASYQHLFGLDLADPHFADPRPIDMLVGVSVLTSSLKAGIVRGRVGEPIALCTSFGWIVMGECAAGNDYRCNSRYGPNDVQNRNCYFASDLSLDSSLKRFWELESLDSPKPILSVSERACEKRMEMSLRRNFDGRMVIPLTFKSPEKPRFSGSRDIALKRFFSLEKKFKLNPEFKRAYVKFMSEYIECGHMIEIDPPMSSEGHFYYIPHHGILRPDSVTTPLRTVFDASAKDVNGTSLNDALHPGPKLQNDLFQLLVRFRWHAIVFSGDVKQMYRQFLVHPEDSNYQRILWRPSSDHPVKDYRLLTVTYGVSCAPYQALWCIARLVKDFSASLPLGAKVLGRDTYVDDIVTGASSVEEAKVIRAQLEEILSSSCLQLRKFTSNSPEFLKGLPESYLYSDGLYNFEEEHDFSLKILGLSWLPKIDRFTYKTSSLDKSRCTKRTVLSDIAKIFDPLGLLSPVVFLAKYIMQLLWLAGVDWDDDIPAAIAQEWHKFKTQLSSLSELSIPRRMIESFVSLQLHGFCDASERGYCAVVYLRVVCNDGSVVVRLCCAKSKVAPLRRCSIPRLELLAAVLLSDLVVSFREALKDVFMFEDVYAWSDSNVALTWIRSCPSKWKTFVANRVASIQENISPCCWRHVPGAENPSDCGSRGLLPDELSQTSSWWAGPPWLSEPPQVWPQSDSLMDKTALEEEKIYTFFSANNTSFIDNILNRFSSLKYILRVLAYCFRYLNNLNNPVSRQSHADLHLSCEETTKALEFLVKHVQECAFSSELRCLTNKSLNSLSKPIRKLSPFLDDRGIVRVGGRLSKGNLSFDVKHPRLLPRDHRLTTLIVEDYHQRFAHPGVQTLQNLIAQEFWILSSKRAIRSVVSSCIRCFRARPRVAPPPQMGDLPAYRLNQLKPFSSSAVDFAGPFDISLGRGKGLRTFKSYICVFVCTVTKAIHFELVSELTSEAYLAALRRFISRRGRCSRLVSDQGRNFIGAFNMLNELMMKASKAEQIDFVFNPPGSPHFSGLVEAGVKSVKTHLLRVIGSQRLTFEEFYTVLTQIEAMLNSRPLSPFSSDPNDLSVLTPGHFLTLEPLTIIPEHNFIDVKIGPLQRWKLIQRIHQEFWRKWHLEYLHTLHQRNKWYHAREEIPIGTLVLIVNEQCNPMHWKLGRIIQLHKGTDGICRVVTVKTDSGEYKRPLVKLCPLPFEH